MAPQATHVRLGIALSMLIAGSASSTFLYGGEVLFRADFNSPERDSFTIELLQDANVFFAPAAGPDGSGAVEVEYEGYERGSRRVNLMVPLKERVREATLSYDVRFCDDFRFVRGGKLHGLGPVEPVTGGNPVEPHRWSARVLFWSDATLGAYVYAQDMGKKYGLVFVAPDFSINTSDYYALSLFIKLNDIGRANGEVAIYVNGKRIISEQGLVYRTSPDDRALISSLMFSTFHGGHTPDWAPKTDDGQYATECAHFDNMTVHEGLHIRSAGRP